MRDEWSCVALTPPLFFDLFRDPCQDVADLGQYLSKRIGEILAI